MPRKWIGFIVCLLALAGLVLAWRAVIASALLSILETQTQTVPGDQPTPQRAREAGPDVPTISFIDSPSPTCSRPVKGTDICYIQWQQLNVSAAASQYVISMTVAIDGLTRAYYSGFFQGSMYVPYGMTTPGFRVSCGVPGSSGSPDMGKAYSYVIQARDTHNLSASNTGTVTCPGDVVSIAKVTLSGPPVGYVNTPYLFNAGVQPVTTTLPVTYTWAATGLPTQVMTDGLATSHSLKWNTPGLKTIAIQAQNLGNQMSATVNIQIVLRHAYLPITRRR